MGGVSGLGFCVYALVANRRNRCFGSLDSTCMVGGSIYHVTPLPLSLAVGTLYPAYCSFKAVRTKNVRAYVKWMMYWIVFAIYLFIENFTDSFLSW